MSLQRTRVYCKIPIGSEHVKILSYTTMYQGRKGTVTQVDHLWIRTGRLLRLPGGSRAHIISLTPRWPKSDVGSLSLAPECTGLQSVQAKLWFPLFTHSWRAWLPLPARLWLHCPLWSTPVLSLYHFDALWFCIFLLESQRERIKHGIALAITRSQADVLVRCGIRAQLPERALGVSPACWTESQLALLPVCVWGAGPCSNQF